MKKIQKKVTFSKSGSGSYTPRILPKMAWLKDMNITPEDNEISMEYDEEKKEIIIKKWK